MNTLKNKLTAGTTALLVAIASMCLSGALWLTHSPAPKAGAVPLPNSDTVFPNCIASGDMTECWESVSVASASSTAFMKNNDTDTEWVDLAHLMSGGTASSSYKLYVGVAATQAAISAANLAYTAPSYPQLINAWTLATSTTASSTSSYDSAVNPTANNHMIAVPAGQLLYVKIQQGDNNCQAQPTNGGCESATSTARGISPQLFIRWHSTTTPQQ